MLVCQSQNNQKISIVWTINRQTDLTVRSVKILRLNFDEFESGKAPAAQT